MDIGDRILLIRAAAVTGKKFSAGKAPRADIIVSQYAEPYQLPSMLGDPATL
jgi:hypothetical protein